MALIFPQVGYPSFSPCQVLSRLIHPESENAAFRKLRHFSSSRISVSDNCNAIDKFGNYFYINFIHA